MIVARVHQDLLRGQESVDEGANRTPFAARPWSAAGLKITALFEILVESGDRLGKGRQ